MPGCVQCHSVILQQQQTTACSQCAIPKIWSCRRIRNTLYPRFGHVGVSGIRYTQDLVLSAYPEYAIPKIWSCRRIRNTLYPRSGPVDVSGIRYTQDLVLSAYRTYSAHQDQEKTTFTLFTLKQYGNPFFRIGHSCFSQSIRRKKCKNVYGFSRVAST